MNHKKFININFYLENTYKNIVHEYLSHFLCEIKSVLLVKK